MTRVAVIYYSATGNVHRLAKAVAQGAEQSGCEVRLRGVAELAPDEAIQRNPAWARHQEAIRGTVPEASLDDLEWADGYAFGTPTRFGTAAAQLKQFLDTTGGLWQRGVMTDKPVTSFTSAMNTHGGQESTILSLNNVFYHWGSVIISPGYTDDAVFGAGGNPYGTSSTSGAENEGPNGAALDAARYQGQRLGLYARHLADLRVRA
jgi:NAD(P)H dehydrogenase (quinone)